MKGSISICLAKEDFTLYRFPEKKYGEQIYQVQETVILQAL